MGHAVSQRLSDTLTRWELSVDWGEGKGKGKGKDPAALFNLGLETSIPIPPEAGRR